jgi:hypothetical protein
VNISIQNFRAGPWNNVLAYFDIAIDNTLLLVGFTLFKSQQGNYYFKSPAKQRLDKEKKPVKGENGYDIWDEHIRLMMEKEDDKSKLTEEANDFRKEVLSLAVEQLEKGSKGRGSAPAANKAGPPAAAPGRVPVKTKPKDEEFEEFPGGNNDDAEDDDLPFN